jgi:hypothetical protein
MPAAVLFFCVVSNYMNMFHESVQNLQNDLLHHNITWRYTKRPRNRQNASWRQNRNFYKSGEPPNVTVFINPYPAKVENRVSLIVFQYMYIQQHATLHSLFISGNCYTCFGWCFNPSSEAQTTVYTASGICHTVSAICLYRGIVGTALL